MNNVKNDFDQNRAGKYIKQLSGDVSYKAFSPTPLPPNPELKIDSSMQSLLSKADRAIGGLDTATEFLPDSDYFILSYLRKEATLSSQIEGTQATFEDAAKMDAGISDPETPNDTDEIINYVSAINYGLKRMKDEQFPLSLRLMREIHAVLLSGVRGQNKHPGEFRTSQNWIGSATINTASFVPPDPDTMTHALHDFEDFLHNPIEMPTLIKIALIHSQFETIHPFLDGNGRLGRLLITILLCHHGVLSRPALYLSDFFNQYRSEYYDRLHVVHEKGDYESWVKFFLEGVWLVSEEATSTAKQIKLLRDKHVERISELSSRSSKNSLELLRHLFGNPFIQIDDAEKVVHLAYPNARNLIEKLVDLQILYPYGNRQRGRTYFYKDYLDIILRKRDYRQKN